MSIGDTVGSLPETLNLPKVRSTSNLRNESLLPKNIAASGIDAYQTTLEVESEYESNNNAYDDTSI